MPEPDRRADANIGGWLEAHAVLRPERTAIRVAHTGQELSYRALAELSHGCSRALQQFGVVAGDRVALALRSEPLYLALYFAAARLGAILLPLNTRLSGPELDEQLLDAEPRIVIRTPEVPIQGPGPAGTRLIERDAFVSEIPERADPVELAPGGEAPQVLMYTSGSTGRPKGALLPHRKTLYNTLNAELYFGLHEDDVSIVPVPLFHSFGLKILSIPTLFCGGTLVLVDRFDPSELQQTVAHHRGTLLGAVPVMYRRMLRAGIERDGLAALRVAFCAGAPLDRETIHAFAEHGVVIRQGYGQTETSILCCLDAENALRMAGSVGRPVHYGEVQIADEAGNPAPEDSIGEVVVRGPTVMTGYWRRAEETAESRIAGWHRTGDLGRMDREGFVTLVGRCRELYISGGENVYPAEVERVLEAHPGIAAAAVVGRPDREWGEAGDAYVVPLDEELDPEELLQFAAQRLARYKLPRSVRFLDELPRTAAGKIRKHALPAAPSN